MGRPPGRPRRRSRHGRRRVARCPGAGHWSEAPSSHSVHRWPSMGRLSYRSPRALAPHRLVEADTYERWQQRAATLIVAGDDEGRGLQQLKPTGEPPHTEARSRSRTWRAAPLAASPQPALSSSRGVAHARSSVLARPVCMARCGAEWGQCRRTKGERAREATPRVENVSVRRGLPSATRPPPAGSRSQVSAADRAARAIEAGRVCAQRRTYPVTAPGGAHLPQHRTEHRGHHHQWRLEHVANPSGLPASPTRVSGRARAHMCVCSARLGPRTCARAHVGGIITQPLSAST